MLKIYHANKLEALLPHLATQLVDAPGNPFQSEVILVQNPGMAQWLKLQIAGMFKVAANIDFPLPSSFVWRVFRQVWPQLPEQSAFVKEAMVWKLMAILPQLLDRDEFLPLKHYLQDQGEQQNERKCLQLVQQIADLFDQYLVYRPEWINSWERGEDESPAAEKKLFWQPALWRELVDYARSLDQSTSHRANLFKDTAQRLIETRDEPNTWLELPERIFVFGISSLAPNYLTVLDALSQHIDVHIMLFNPCMMYWGDIRSRRHHSQMQAIWHKHGVNNPTEQALPAINPLLASMAQQGRDYLDLLHQYDTEDIDAFIDIEPRHLLSMLQSDVLHLQHRAADSIADPCADSSHFKTTLSPEDDSLQVHSCYSALREVENLQQQLLALFAKDPLLTPKDVVVMMADVDSYAPYVQAIFANAEPQHYIPWSISDRSVRAEDAILNSFLWFLQLPLSRVTLLEVVDVLSVPLIASRFGLDDESIAVLRNWLQLSGVRWGLHAGQKQQFDLPEVEQNTWSFGLRRLLLGYAMSAAGAVQSELLADALLPVAAVEGMNAEYLGKLIRFVEALEIFRTRLNCKHTSQEWQLLINELLQTFYFAESVPEALAFEHAVRALTADEEQSLQTIREQLADWCDIVDASGLHTAISFQIFFDAIKARLNTQRSGQRFLAGQVNFCTLMPMRSMPFKVVCLLGMNDGVYPRSIQPWGVDLMACDYRKGDRSRRDDDRYLFLEALLSAREKLIISYQGRSIRDSSEKMPSVLVNELLEYCQQAFVLAGDETLAAQSSANRLRQHLVVQHPLQVFDPVYFSNESSPNYFSYSKHWYRAAEAMLAQDSPSPEVFCEQALQAAELEDYVELPQLIACLLNPARYFLNKRLGVYAPFENTELDIDEPFVLDGLQRYQIKQQLLEDCLHGEIDLAGEFSELQKRYKATGKLPVGAIGAEVLQSLIADVTPLWRKLKHLSQLDVAGFKEGFTDIRVFFDQQDNLPRRVLAGRIANVSACGLIHFRPAEFKAKDKLRLWIEHLALCAATDRRQASMFIGLEKIYRLAPLDTNDAKRLLHKYLGYLDIALQQPLAFIPETSWACYDNRSDAAKQAKAMQISLYGNSFRNIPGDWDDYYVQTCFAETFIDSEQFHTLAMDVFATLEEHLSKVSDEEFSEFTQSFSAIAASTE